MNWREAERRRREVAAEAKRLPRERAAPFPRVVLGATTLTWVLVVVWLIWALPDRVPLHWSMSDTPDRWGTKGEALAFAVALPLLTAFPLILISRLALIWPDGINLPDKDWWLETPQRLVRFERLLREDMMLMAAATLAILVVADLSIAAAAQHPEGRAPWWMLPALGVALVAMLAVIVRMLLPRRYRPDRQGHD